MPDRDVVTVAYPALDAPGSVGVPTQRPGDGAHAAGFAAGFAAGARAAARTAARAQAVADQRRLADEHRRTAEHAAALAALAAATRGAQSRTAPVLAEAEATLLRCALELAEAVLGVELSDGATGAVAALARVTAADVEPVVVRLNPDDVRALGSDPELPDGARLVADPSLARGDAVADLPDGWLDARIGTALDRARAALASGGAS
ncbi:FliH/SctL family protein [Cellulomonas sp. T2.31MG-18]|uniref:FliH/SctL family protein n=1 Tax=Cellulomonas sp. T2.31MG-18 TaxID=3157619 RepID=UPI003672ECCF